MDTDVRKKIVTFIQKETPIDISKIDFDGELREQVNLDSMQFVGILSRLENDLNIEIPISAMEAETLNEFLDIIEKELSVKNL